MLGIPRNGLGRYHAIGSPEDPPQEFKVRLPLSERDTFDRMRQGKESRNDTVRRWIQEKRGKAQPLDFRPEKP
jgi:hypothetical protein